MTRQELLKDIGRLESCLMPRNQEDEQAFENVKRFVTSLLQESIAPTYYITEPDGSFGRANPQPLPVLASTPESAQ